MKELDQRILKAGIIQNGDVLNVSAFINQLVDTDLLKSMAKEVKRLFPEKIDKILTIEASGLPFAPAVGMEYSIPIVFAKKNKTSNLSENVVSSKVESYTHHNTNYIFVTKGYIKKGDNILVVDDFLAMGNALKGLFDLVKQSEANIVGAAIEIEKVYQGGGNELRNLGYRIESLASILKMENNNIIFK